MRQEVKNDKVLRAIAVGIAAMMATSAMPATVLANENPEAPDTPTEAPEASGGSQESESSSASQQSAESTEQSAVQTASASEMQEAVVTLGGETTEASGLITTAVEQTASIGDAMVTENVTGAQAVFEGVDGAAGVAQQLDGAKAILDDAANKEAIADVLINTADETVDALNTQTSNYQTADEKATQNADSAIGNANTANTSDSEQEAYAARDAAIENLGLVEEGFEEANIAYTNALSKAEDAELEYEAAEKEHQLALAKVEEAKAKLLEAQMNSTAALEMLKAAEQRAGSLERRAEELQETSEQLNAIRTQYYAMMVQYYQELLGGNAVYNADGSLNVEECAKKVTADKVNGKAKSPGNEITFLGRDLMTKLVEYQVRMDENVDFDNSEFAFGQVGKSGNLESREGKVFESDEMVQGTNEGKDKVVVNKERGVRGGGRLKPNEAKMLRRDDSTQNDNGRTNRFLATYKDKDGVEHSVYYNYVYKSSNYGDTLDMETGMFYLAEIEQDESGTWVTKRIVNENNFDNYQSLLAAIEQSQAVEDYQAAAQAVREATEKVENLTKEIEALQKIGLDGSKLETLKGKLDEANAVLDEATAKKLALQDKVNAARDAVAGIDLSRFDVRPDTDEGGSSDEGAGSTGTGGVSGGEMLAGIGTLGSAGAAGGSTVNPIFDGISLTSTVPGGDGGFSFTDGSGVAGARVDGVEETKSEDISLEKVFAEQPAEQELIQTLEDGLIPMAQSAPETQSKDGMNWWWLLVVTLFGAAGKKMYDDYQEKKKAQAENKDA